MGYEKPEAEIGFLCPDVDMSAKSNQYTFGWVSSAANIRGHGQGGAAIVKKGALTGPPIGIVQDCVKAGHAMLVMTRGVSKLRANGAWAVGDPIGWDTNGLAVKATAGMFAVATALESAVLGDISTVYLYARGVQ